MFAPRSGLGSDPVRARRVPDRARQPDRPDPHPCAPRRAVERSQHRGSSAMKKPALPRIETGVRNLDALLRGGLPKGSVSVFGGAPGAGKTILAQQICFHHARAKQRVLWFSTLSEPTAKTLLYLSQFSFFDREKIEAGDVQFVDLGVILRATGLNEATK